MMSRFTLALAAALALPTIAWAGPLKPEQVSADAKWLAHVDVAAMNETQVLKEVRSIWPEKSQKFRAWMQESYGVDPREEFDSITLYGTGYDQGDCVMILSADYSAKKAEARSTQQDVETMQWRDHTIYTCQAGKMKHGDQQKQASSQDESSKTKKSDRVAWVLLDDDTIVYAKSVRGIKDAVETIEGHASSLAGKDSELTSELPQDVVAYATAVELDSIEHEGAMFPLLRQHKRVCYALGERDGKVFDELKLMARNEQVASQMKQVVEGFTAMLKVSVMDSQPLSKMMENVEVQQEGAKVTASWNGEVQRFASALEEYKSMK